MLLFALFPAFALLAAWVLLTASVEGFTLSDETLSGAEEYLFDVSITSGAQETFLVWPDATCHF